MLTLLCWYQFCSKKQIVSWGVCKKVKPSNPTWSWPFYSLSLFSVKCSRTGYFQFCNLSVFPKKWMLSFAVWNVTREVKTYLWNATWTKFSRSVIKISNKTNLVLFYFEFKLIIAFKFIFIHNHVSKDKYLCVNHFCLRILMNDHMKTYSLHANFLINYWNP